MNGPFRLAAISFVLRHIDRKIPIMDQVHLLGGNSCLQNPICIKVNSTLDIKISHYDTPFSAKKPANGRMLLFDKFFWRRKISWLPSKNRRTYFLAKLQCSVFSSVTLFLEGSQLNFSSHEKLSDKSISK